MDDDFIEGVHYYIDENGLFVLTRLFLKNRGQCCGTSCRHCPYFPRHAYGSTELEADPPNPDPSPAGK